MVFEWTSGPKTGWLAGAVAAIVAFAVASCAVPVAPTGGPPDDTPPSLVAEDPPDGSTGFSGRTIELTFSEHVDRQTLPGAVSIQPEPEGRLEFDWDGRTARITLPEDPRPETTYILSIDNSLRDARNVALDRPITLAFATGSTINAGRLSGRVVRAHDGSPGAGIDVFAYADADSALFDGRPLYRTQTGRDGTFTFSYLRETDYFVVGVRDLNGNRRLDSNEAVALPPVPFVPADTLTSPPDDSGFVWILNRYDEIPPSLDRISSTGRRHLEIRFSEPVRVLSSDASDLMLRNAMNDPVAILDVYAMSPYPGRIVGLFTDELEAGTYTLSGRFPVSDSTGNRATPVDVEFNIADGAPLSEPHIVSLLPDSSAGARYASITDTGVAETGPQAGDPVVLWPGDSAGVRFDIPAPDALARGLMAARDTAGADLSARFRRSTPTTWVFRDSSLNDPFELVVPPSASSSDSSFAIVFVRSDASMVGEISGTVMTRPHTVDGPPIVVEMYRAGAARPVASGPGAGARPPQEADPGRPLRVVKAQNGSFIVRGLPDGLRVRLRAFIDTNDNGTWDAGRPVPFLPPEPATWMEASEPVRARWETALPDTLYLNLHD